MCWEEERDFIHFWLLILRLRTHLQGHIASNITPFGLLFSCSVTSDCLQPHGLTAACQASLSFTISWSLLKLISIESVMPSNHLILFHPLLLLPSIFPSIRVFFKSVLHIRWPQYWSFSFSIIASNKYLGLISFRIDWFDFFDNLLVSIVWFNCSFDWISITSGLYIFSPSNMGRKAIWWTVKQPSELKL